MGGANPTRITARRKGGSDLRPCRKSPRAACRGGSEVSKRAAQEIDAERACHDVEPPGAHIGFEHVVAPQIAAAAKRLGDAIGESSGIAEAEIESLRADRREDMRRLADQRRSLRGKPVGAETGHREFSARAHIGDRAEQAAEPLAQGIGEAFRVEPHQLH